MLIRPDRDADENFLIVHKEHEMNMNFRKTFLASAIAALISAPAFAAEGIQYEGKSAPGKAGMEKPVTGKPMDMDKMGGKSTGMTTRNQAWANNPIYSRSADDLDGTDVVDSAGDKVGTIKQVVLTSDRRSAHAVIATGGMLGLGARDIVVSLDELTAVDDELQLNQTKEQIEARKEYQSEQYVELKGDKPIRGEFSGMTAGNQAWSDNPIYSRSADDLDGTDVVDNAGDKVGTIKRVVLTPDRSSAHAVVATGGMLGLGARDIVVSLDELTAVDDALQLNQTKEQIEARKEYQSEQYVELKGDKPIRSEFSAFEPAENTRDPASAPKTPGYNR